MEGPDAVEPPLAETSFDSAASSPILRPADSVDASPLLSSTSISSSPPEFLLRDDPFSGLTLVDLVVSLDAHLDLLSRRLKDRIPTLRKRTGDSTRRSVKGEPITAKERGFREVARFRQKVGERLKKLNQKWNEAQVVGTRDKISFMAGVNNVFLTALAIGFRPQWLPMIYTMQATYFLPVRVYSYRKLSYHYFLFDFCYFMNVLCLLFIWVAPDNALLFESCYTLTHGPLATAIATWRNSLVFHSFDKVTSLFIHIYPPLVLAFLRHGIPGAEKQYPALAKLPELRFWRSIGISSFIYLLWQFAYYHFIIVRRRQKIQTQGRVTSFTYLLNDKKGWIGRTLHKIPAQHRELSFMAAQYVYTVVTIAPAILLFYESSLWNMIYMFIVFNWAVYNGATFYLEVFLGKLSKELARLQKELEDVQQEQRNSESGRFTLSRANSSLDDDHDGLRRRSVAVSDAEPSPDFRPLTSGLLSVSPTKLE